MGRLYRSRDERILAGVCGGIAAYFDVDPMLVRLLTVLAVLVQGAGLVLYLIAWLVLPEEPETGASAGRGPDAPDRRPRQRPGPSRGSSTGERRDPIPFPGPKQRDESDDSETVTEPDQEEADNGRAENGREERP